MEPDNRLPAVCAALVRVLLEELAKQDAENAATVDVVPEAVAEDVARSEREERDRLRADLARVTSQRDQLSGAITGGRAESEWRRAYEETNERNGELAQELRDLQDANEQLQSDLAIANHSLTKATTRKRRKPSKTKRRA